MRGTRILTPVRQTKIGVSVSCMVCNKPCSNAQRNHRRRDAFGNYYCRRHGDLIQRRTNTLVARDARLGAYVRQLPTLFYYMRPGDLGLRCDPPVTYPEPVCARAAPVAPTASCAQCGKGLAKPETRRLGCFCNACGLQFLRAYKRQRWSDERLREMLRADPQLAGYLRPEVIHWAADFCK